MYETSPLIMYRPIHMPILPMAGRSGLPPGNIGLWTLGFNQKALILLPTKQVILSHSSKLEMCCTLNTLYSYQVQTLYLFSNFVLVFYETTPSLSHKTHSLSYLVGCSGQLSMTNCN